MIIFRRELRRNFKSFLVWTSLLILLNGITMAFYPTVAKESEQFTQLLKQMPAGLRTAFNLDQLNIGDLLGYFGTRSYLLVTLFGSVFIALLSAGIISKEESDKTSEFLLAKPVARKTVVTSKALCVLFYTLFFDICFSLANLIFFELFKQAPYSKDTLFLLSLGPFLLHLTFAAIGLFLSATTKRGKSNFSLTLGIILGTYFTNILASLTKSLANLKYLTPFRYIDAANIITRQSIEGVYLGIMAALILTSVFLTYWVYNRKDIAG